MTDVQHLSGPAGSEQFEHPWHFQEYVPDVMVCPFSSILQLQGIQLTTAGHEYRKFRLGLFPSSQSGIQ
jgi:hypothetical protein